MRRPQRRTLGRARLAKYLDDPPDWLYPIEVAILQRLNDDRRDDPGYGARRSRLEEADRLARKKSRRRFGLKEGETASFEKIKITDIEMIQITDIRKDAP